MYSLIQDTPERSVDLGSTKRLHWLIGRHATCDVVLDDPGVSRFHATIFYAGKRLFLIDHSLNGTYLCRTEEEVRDVTERPLPLGIPAKAQGEDTLVIDPYRRVLDAPDLEASDPNLSVAELRLAQSRTRLSRVAGYESRRPTDPDSVAPLLDMIYSDTECENLAGMGRRLEPGVTIVVSGRQSHRFTIRGGAQ